MKVDFELQAQASEQKEVPFSEKHEIGECCIQGVDGGGWKRKIYERIILFYVF